MAPTTINQSKDRIANNLEAELNALRIEVEQLRLIASHSTDMISRHNLSGDYTYASTACKAILGYAPEDLVGHSAYEFFHPEDLAAITKSHESILEVPDIQTVAYRIRRKDGTYIWLESTSKTIRVSSTNEAIEIISVSRDVSHRKDLENKLLQLASHDTLTGLPRPHIFYENLDRALQNARRTGKKLAILYVDLDKFKGINDVHGHLIGDHFLQAFAVRLKDSLRGSDTVGRLGGDEFGIILENVSDLAEAEASAERILKAFEPSLQVDQIELQASFSIGVSFYPDQATEAKELLHLADNAMYLAKGSDQPISLGK